MEGMLDRSAGDFSLSLASFRFVSLILIEKVMGFLFSIVVEANTRPLPDNWFTNRKPKITIWYEYPRQLMIRANLSQMIIWGGSNLFIFHLMLVSAVQQDSPGLRKSHLIWWIDWSFKSSWFMLNFCLLTIQLKCWKAQKWFLGTSLNANCIKSWWERTHRAARFWFRSTVRRSSHKFRINLHFGDGEEFGAAGWPASSVPH